MININKVTKKFENLTIDIDCTINSSEIFGIIGESGSGKTTVLKLLQKIITADSGSITINGHFSTVFQEANLLNNLTVLDNVALPLRIKKNVQAQRVIEALEFVGLKSFANAYPRELSGGQKQRVSIARAIVTHPNILLCDEPTASLDKNTSKDMVDLLLRINQKYATTIVLVTHDLAIAKALCNKVAIMKSGRLIEVLENNKTPIPDNIPYYEYIQKMFA